MKKPLVTLLIAMLALVSMIGWTRKGEAYAKETWEYRITYIGPTNTQDPTPEQILNRHGKDGWEMVQGNLNGPVGDGLYIFKRRK